MTNIEFFRKQEKSKSNTTNPTLIQHGSSFFQVTNKEPLRIRRDSIAAQLKPLFLNNEFQYKHKKCEQDYERAMMLRAMNDQSSLKQAEDILAQLFYSRMMTYQTDQVTYALKEHITLNYWKILEETRRSHQDQRSLLKMLRIAHSYLKECWTKCQPKNHNLQMIAVILARQEYSAGFFSEALVFCDEAIQFSSKHCKSNSLLLKSHYLKTSIYNKLRHHDLELDQINKCLHFIKTVNKNSDNETYNNFRKTFLLRKQQLIKIKQKQLGYSNSYQDIDRTIGLNFTFNTKGLRKRTRSSNFLKSTFDGIQMGATGGSVINHNMNRRAFSDSKAVIPIASQTEIVEDPQNGETITKKIKNHKITFPVKVFDKRLVIQNARSKIRIQRKKKLTLDMNAQRRQQLEIALKESESTKLRSKMTPESYMMLMPRPGQRKFAQLLQDRSPQENSKNDINSEFNRTLRLNIVEPIVRKQLKDDIISKLGKQFQEELILKFINRIGSVKREASNIDLNSEKEDGDRDSQNGSIVEDQGLGSGGIESFQSSKQAVHRDQQLKSCNIALSNLIFREDFGYLKKATINIRQHYLNVTTIVFDSIASMIHQKDSPSRANIKIKAVFELEKYGIAEFSHSFTDAFAEASPLQKALRKLISHRSECQGNVQQIQIQEQIVSILALNLKEVSRLNGTKAVFVHKNLIDTEGGDFKSQRKNKSQIHLEKSIANIDLQEIMNVVPIYDYLSEKINLFQEHNETINALLHFKSFGLMKIWPIVEIIEQSYIVLSPKPHFQLIEIKASQKPRINLKKYLDKQSYLESELQPTFQSYLNQFTEFPSENQQKQAEEYPQHECSENSESHEQQVFKVRRSQIPKFERSVFERIVNRLVIFFTYHTLVSQQSSSMILLDSMKYLLIQSQKKSCHELNRFFNFSTVSFIAVIQGENYMIKATQYGAKKLYSNNSETFYKIQLVKRSLKNRKMFLILTEIDLSFIMKKHSDNQSKLCCSKMYDTFVQISKKLIIKKDSIYQKIGIATESSKFYLKNYFRHSSERKNRITNSFLQQKLSLLNVLCQKASILKFEITKISPQMARSYHHIDPTQGNPIQKRYYSVVTVATIENTMAYELRIYLPSLCRHYSLSFGKEIVNYFDEDFLFQVFGDKVDPHASEQDLASECNQLLLGLSCSFCEAQEFWSRILREIKYEALEHDNMKYLVATIGGYRAFLKDSSVSSYLAVSKSVIHLQICLERKHQSINFVNYNERLAQTLQADMRNIKRFENCAENSLVLGFDSVSEEQTKDCVVYVTLTNTYSGKKINFFYSLFQIVKLLEAEELGYISLKTTKIFKNPDIRHTQKLIGKDIGLKNSYNQFNELSFSYARVLRGLEVLQEKLIDRLSGIYQIHQFFASAHQQAAFNEKIKKILSSYSEKDIEPMAKSQDNQREIELVEIQKGEKRNSKNQRVICLQKTILDIHKKKISCIFYDEEKKIFKVTLFNNQTFEHQILQIPTENHGYPFLNCFNKVHLKAMKKRIYRYHKNMILTI